MFEHCEAGSTGDGVRLQAAVGMLARSGVPAWMPVAQVLALLTAVPPSGHVAVVVAALQERNLAPAERVAVLALCGRLSSWLTAVTDAAIVAVTGPGSAEPDPRDYGRDEVALALRMSTRSSPARVLQARARRGRLRSVGEALAAGLLTPGMADAAVDELIDAPVDVAELVCERVLPGAAGMSGPQFARALTRAHLVIDAPAGAARHEVAKADRGVWMRPRQDGMADVVTRMTAVEAVTYVRGLDAQAHQLVADYKAAAALAAADESGTVVEVPSIGAARVEVMLGWAEESLADESLPRAHGRRVDVGLTMTLDTYLGFADDPAELDGYGPICAEQARTLLPEASLRRLVTDPLTGELLDYGQKTYRPPQVLEDFVIARAPRCLVRGCPQPARLCDIDHRIPFARGGPTSADNLDPLCERHHIMKDEGGWQLLVDMWGSRWLVTGAGVRYPLRRESIAPSLLPAFSGSGHDDPWSVPDDNLLERAIAHAHIWAAEQATRQHNADLEPPF